MIKPYLAKSVTCPIHKTKEKVYIFCDPNKNIICNGCDTHQPSAECIPCYKKAIENITPDDFDTSVITVPGL